MKIKVLLITFTVLTLLPVSRPVAGTEAPKKILVLQDQAFTAFELSFRGFKEGIAEGGYGGNIEVARFNAENNRISLKAKVLEIKKEKGVDLIFTLGTPATRMAMAEIHDIPIIFTEVAAPEYSGIIKDWKSSGTNVTGVETPKYLGMVVDILHDLIPFKTIGLLYLQGSPSHETTLRQMKLVSRNLGTKLVYDGFPLRNKTGVKISREALRRLITEKLKTLLPQVDVFFVQPSKSFFDNFDLFLKGFRKYDVISAGAPAFIKKGVVLGLERDRVESGKQCARYALKIFRGTPPTRLPMDVGRHFSISFNLKAAAVVGFSPPLDLLGAADVIYQDFD